MSGRTQPLLAEELALVAMSPRTGRHPLGTGYALNACLAGLLVAELQLADRPADSMTLAAAARVVAERGPRIPDVLSHMDRGLKRATGSGTWDLVTAELADIAPARDLVVERLRAAAAADLDLDLRTALLLSFIGPAKLLEVVAPHRRGRRHARRRIDHALDDTPFEPLRKAVRRAIADQEATAAVASTVAVAGSC